MVAGQVLAEPHLGGTFVDQLLVDVGIVRLQQAHQTRQERVAVTDLWRTPAVPVERLVGRLRHRGVVSFEHRHGVPSPSQRQCRAKAANSSSDDRHFHRLTLIALFRAHHGSDDAMRDEPLYAAYLSSRTSGRGRDEIYAVSGGSSLIAGFHVAGLALDGLEC